MDCLLTTSNYLTLFQLVRFSPEKNLVAFCQVLIIRKTVSAYLSMSDNAALGVVAWVVKCGGSDLSITLRVSWIDATTAGPSGGWGLATALATTLAQFAAAGLEPSYTITITACGILWVVFKTLTLEILLIRLLWRQPILMRVGHLTWHPKF